MLNCAFYILCHGYARNHGYSPGTCLKHLIKVCFINTKCIIPDAPCIFRIKSVVELIITCVIMLSCYIMRIVNSKIFWWSNLLSPAIRILLCPASKVASIDPLSGMGGIQILGGFLSWIFVGCKLTMTLPNSMTIILRGTISLGEGSSLAPNSFLKNLINLSPMPDSPLRLGKRL